MWVDNCVTKWVKACVYEYCQWRETTSCTSEFVFYKDLAWGGLTGTKAFLSFSEQERNRIINTVRAERYDNKVTTNGHAQKGEKADC